MRAKYENLQKGLRTGFGDGIRLNDGKTKLRKILKGRIVKLGFARWVAGIAGRNTDDHALTGAREENSVGILLIEPPFRFVYSIPPIAAE